MNFYITSLFTNIPLEKSVEIIKNRLMSNSLSETNLSISAITDFLE